MRGMERLSEPRAGSLLFSVPTELFDQFVNLLPTQEDAIRLSQTCTALRAYPPLLCKAYQELTDRYDLPVTNETNRHDLILSSPHCPNRSWDEFCITHKPKFDLRFHSISDQTGPYVRSMAMFEWASPHQLGQLVALCPNLRSVDFTGISEPIDNARAYRDVDYPHRFSWDEMLQHRTSFFTPLQSAKVSYEGQRFQNLDSQLDLLPIFLKSARNLEDLEIHQASGDATGKCRIVALSNPKASKLLQHQILCCISEKLHTLSFYHAHGLTRNLALFLKPFKALRALKTIRTSLYHDLMITEGPMGHAFDINDSLSLSTVTMTPLEYIIAAKDALEYGDWNFLSTDEGDEHPSSPALYCDLVEPENLQYIRWLKIKANWNPLFHWSDYLFQSSLLGRERFGRASEMPDLDTSPIRRLFEEMKNLQMPVRMLLQTQRWKKNGLFFAHATGVDPHDDWTINKLRDYELQYYSASYHNRRRDEEIKPAFEAHVHDMIVTNGNSAYTPRLYDFSSPSEPGMCSQYENNLFKVADWKLSDIGDLVDDLRILWDTEFGFLRELDAFWRDYDHRGDRNHALAYLIEITNLRRLKHEAEQIAPLFSSLAIDFPNLTRLALYIPAALYPDNDALFISNVLPGDGWTVQHHGSGGGDEAPRTPPICQNQDEYDESQWFTFELVRQPEQHMERNARWELNSQYLPLIHRVFTRTPGVPNSRRYDDENHTIKRPVIDVQNPSMLQLIQQGKM